MAYQFKVQLKNVTKPPVWRRVVVPEKFTFHDLHEVILMTFGWTGYHLYQFCPSGYGSYPVIALPSDEDWEEPNQDAAETKLNEVFTKEKQKYTYIYDFGDDWIHSIELEKILPEAVEKPSCLAGKGACPPEDCGGPWGYENLKEILADLKHEEHEEMKEWLGLEEDEQWDANEFNVEDANEVLQDFEHTDPSDDFRF